MGGDTWPGGVGWPGMILIVWMCFPSNGNEKTYTTKPWKAGKSSKIKSCLFLVSKMWWFPGRYSGLWWDSGVEKRNRLDFDIMFCNTSKLRKSRRIWFFSNRSINQIQSSFLRGFCVSKFPLRAPSTQKACGPGSVPEHGAVGAQQPLEDVGNVLEPISCWIIWSTEPGFV